VFVSRVSGDSPKFFCAANALVCVFFSSLSFFFQFFHTRGRSRTKKVARFPLFLSLSVSLSLCLCLVYLNPTRRK
jgi:hypothetical protein